MTELIRFINSFQELDAETEQAIRKYFVKETLKKNEFIIEEGQICKKVCFIHSGIVRRFYLTDGQAITDNNLIVFM